MTTNPLGIFEAPYLRPGRYQVNVGGPGFKTAVRDNIDFQVESRLARFRLELGDVTTTVAVTAETPLIESSSSSLGQSVDAMSSIGWAYLQACR